MTTTTILKESECHNCQYAANAATTFEGARAPRPGDLTLCLNCGELACFEEDLTLRKSTAADCAGMSEEQREMARRCGEQIRRRGRIAPSALAE